MYLWARLQRIINDGYAELRIEQDVTRLPKKKKTLLFLGANLI